MQRWPAAEPAAIKFVAEVLKFVSNQQFSGEGTGWGPFEKTNWRKKQDAMKHRILANIHSQNRRSILRGLAKEPFLRLHKFQKNGKV